MDLCLMIEGQEGVSWPQWVALAEACEAHGIPALFRSDHYLNLDGTHPERGSLDAWATLSALAAVTRTLELGTLVSPATFRHPSVLAKMVTTADQISGGRISLGLGAGWHEREHAAYGFPFPPMKERMAILAEQLAIVHGHWGAEPFTVDGEHYRLDGLDAQPKPDPGRARPHLLLGGQAGPKVAALAARYADEYNTLYVTPELARERRERIAEACAEAGRDPIPLSAMMVVVAGRDTAELEDRAARVAAIRGFPTEDVLHGRLGDGWIIGLVPEVVARLGALRDAGVSRVMCQHFDHGDLDFVALLGSELAPQLR